VIRAEGGTRASTGIVIFQLREALAECELAIRVGEAAGIEYPVASSTAARFVGEG